MSEEGRRRLREAERGRVAATIGILLFAGAMLWRGVREGTWHGWSYWPSAWRWSSSPA